jgi:dihydrofolate reductase
MIYAIFAVDENGGIGNQGTIPWPLNKEDMMWFKKTTQNQIVVMGRKSWESPDMPKPLPGRANVVFTNSFIDQENIKQIRGNVCEGLQYLENQYSDKEIYVIGGSNLLMQAKPVIKKAYITKIPGEYICDTFVDVEEFLKGFKLVRTFNLGSCKVEEYATI